MKLPHLMISKTATVVLALAGLVALLALSMTAFYLVVKVVVGVLHG